MLKINILLFLLLFCAGFNTKAQKNNSGVAVYKVYPNMKGVEALSPKNNIYAEIKDALKHLQQ